MLHGLDVVEPYFSDMFTLNISVVVIFVTIGLILFTLETFSYEKTPVVFALFGLLLCNVCNC